MIDATNASNKHVIVFKGISLFCVIVNKLLNSPCCLTCKCFYSIMENSVTCENDFRITESTNFFFNSILFFEMIIFVFCTFAVCFRLIQFHFFKRGYETR